MLFYFKIGWRNLLKNYQRSLKTLLTIVVGFGACILAQGFMAHTLWGLRESLINGGLGHLQVYQQGYLEHSEAELDQYLIPDCQPVLRRLKNQPGVKLGAPRLSFQGMVSAGERSTIFIGMAGFPAVERVLNNYAILKEGSFLKTQKPFGVVIGSGVARKLRVRLGDTVTLMTTLQGGAVNALDVEIIGIMEAQLKAYDEVALLANLVTVQSFINQPKAVDRIVLLLNSTENLAQSEPVLRRLCGLMGLECRNWSQLAGKRYTQPQLFYNLVYVLLMSIIILVVIFAIVNTLNLTIQERVREIGTIRSLGTTRLQVGKIFLAESILIGLGGVLCGGIAGYGMAALLNAWGGVLIPPPPGHARGYTAFFRPDLLPTFRLGILFLMATVVAGFYPAWRVARLRIVDALRWI
jgi:putative ABC transport system permease protein